MKIRHRFGFASGDGKVLRFLNKKNLLYQRDELIITVEAFEDDNEFDALSNLAHKCDAVDVVTAVYEQSELDAAKWLVIRSEWWNQYPQPQEEMGYIYTTYDTSMYCSGCEEYNCGKGLLQKKPFNIKKAPNWGPRNFLMLNWVPDELFVSLKAATVLEKSKLTGFSLWDVFDKSQKPFDTIKQIHVENFLPKSLNVESIKERLVCPNCGFEKIVPNVGPLRFEKTTFENIDYDIVKTEDKFGEIGCDSAILVSHNFYDTVIKNNIGKGLVFEPVELV